MKRSYAVLLHILFLIFAAAIVRAQQPDSKIPLTSARKGETVKAADNSLSISCIDYRGIRGGEHRDPDILSPKSATFSPDGKKIYINSLEGGKTVVYDAAERKKIKVIDHHFPDGNSQLWITPSGFYPFTHYTDGASRPFMGKPVEADITPDGRWLIVPYYRRSFDINAQDPSALAIIDTRTDSIVAMAETGPLPKIVRISNDGRLLAITHWGDNTVGLMDISDPDPHKWHHLPPVTIGKKLNLDYSLTTSVNRDSGSGFLLRGTIFLPGDSLMLVSGMAGPVQVIDVRKREWIGSIPTLPSVRHIAMQGGRLFFSQNTAGQVLSIPVDSVVSAISRMRRDTRSFPLRGLRSVKVGGGARTLELSPSGRFIFVACNSASAIYVVDAKEMKVIASIPADSFPVGLDISPDGSLLVSTSQGRPGSGGGNMVDFFSIEYAEPEPDLSIVTPSETEKTDTIAVAPPSPAAGQPENDADMRRILLIAIPLILLAAALIVIIIRRRSRDS